MDLLKILQGSQGIMRSLVIQFVCWLGWFSTFALAQFDISEGVTGSVNFPALAITCVGNLAVCVTSLIRGRLDLEMGARDVLDILLNPKLENIRGFKHGYGYGLTTCNIQEDVAIGGGGDQPGTASTEDNGVQSSSTRGPETASTEPVLQTASTEQNGVQCASRRVPETASTEVNVIRTASTEGGDLQTTSTAERVLQIDSTEGEVGSENDEEEATAAAEIQDASTRKRGLQTASVIMLSNGRPNWSMRQFIQSNAHVVQSIVLEYLPLKRAINDSKVKEELSGGVTIKSCECRRPRCHCILFWTVEEITSILASRMPGTLKLLSNSLCLLPCSTCLRKGCHECNRESLLRGEGQADHEGQSVVVSDILEDIHARYIRSGEPVCICIPMNDSSSDDWTKVLVTSLRSKDAEGRRVRIMAAEALEGYLAGGRGSKEGTVEYRISSLVVPRLTEVLINIVLTFWLGVDGFSSALVARRLLRDYVVDSNSSGFAANAFLAKAVVKSNADNSQVCQVLTFRGRDRLCIITFISVGCVNLICSLGWVLLICFEGGPNSYDPPSLHRVGVIIAAIGSPWAVAASAFIYSNTLHMDDFSGISVRSVFVLVLVILLVVVMSPVVLPGLLIAATLTDRQEHPYAYPLIGAALFLEMVCFVSWSAVAVKLGIRGFGRWVYGALQILVWVKWATGTYFLNEQNSIELFGRSRHRWMLGWYPSAFWLNAVLAGVRCKWAWKHNHLF